MNKMINSNNANNQIVNVRYIVARIMVVSVVLMLFLFIPANDWTWFNGWMFITTFLITYILQLIYLNKNNPDIIANRPLSMKQNKEEHADQINDDGHKNYDSIILPIVYLLILSSMIIPGLDHRYNWSNVPLYIEVVGVLVIIASQYIIYKVLLINKFGSKTLDIQEDHKVIDTGPYSVVRHPMYSGSILLAFGVPLLLDSWFALIPSILIMILFIIRIKYEEIMLDKELIGYIQYKEKVRYKLVPKLF